MASFSALLRACIQNLKAKLTTSDFGSDYELLCTELSLQWLRLRLWGESLGIDIDDFGRPQDSLFTRPHIQITVIQAVGVITHLLLEIEALRQKYDLKPSHKLSRKQSKPKFCSSFKSSKARKSSSSISSVSPSTTVWERIQENQKQKSFFTLSKWARCDAKKFDHKIKRLKSLIDALEEVSKPREISSLESPSYVPGVPGEDPPPYAAQNSSPSQAVFEDLGPEAALSRPVSVFSSLDDNLFSKHYTALKAYSIERPQDVPPTSLRAREKLLALSESQLRLLRTDTYDDLMRRLEPPFPSFSLPRDDSSYSPERNDARYKLSLLPTHRFRHLVSDVVSEIERRFVFLPQQFGHPNREVFQFPIPVPESINRRYGWVLPHEYQNAAHPISALATVTEEPHDFIPRRRAPIPPQSPPPRSINRSASVPSLPSSSTSSVEIFKSFRVKIHSTTADVLPGTLEKYSIQAPWQNYCLYIIYGTEERCMGLTEKPLRVFKQLQAKGHKPLFMLRKKTAADVEAERAADQRFGTYLVDSDDIFN
ncbi:hypothetical protein G7Y89_g2590 [Cudoniella acicularis]|uniref:Ras-associating domain-containing protein n=1 Tax=Cudoniella acicularis TaxID=354080 RepID=A0A8H4RT85_9HELO|nr:hypothetical protein G7Y89_g2590 [Cudoniella acicularis]